MFERFFFVLLKECSMEIQTVFQIKCKNIKNELD